MRLARPLPLAMLLTAVLIALAWGRAIDHDESQYVAAARLVAAGLLPYRDFAYLQTPLQPFVFAPLAWAFGSAAWPAMRVANALLGIVTIVATWRAMRIAGAVERVATVCAGLLTSCDILLFAAGTARNDALPAALFALTLAPMLRPERDVKSAAAIGLLLAAAAAAKISYIGPALAYGIYALLHREHRPLWVAIGALPVAAFVGWTAWLSPEGFVFGTLTFPAQAPGEYSAAAGRPWKWSLAAKAVDSLKFLALGPALVALTVVLRQRPRNLLGWLVLAGIVAALLPTPTWRQYWLPMLPPLFVLLALVWPKERAWRVALGCFVVVGLIPSAVALVQGSRPSHVPIIDIPGRVATLSPQMLAHAPDRRFATGPFYFRNARLLDVGTERRLHLISHARLDAAFGDDPPDFILTGGEGAWSSGDARLDARLEGWVRTHGWRRVGAWPPLRLYAPPATARRGSPSTSVR